jgi:hypothetical protein
MSSKFNKIINEMKEEAREDLKFKRMVSAQRDILINVGKALVRVEEDVPERTVINEHIRDAVISIGQAIELYNESLQKFKEEYK